MCRPIQIAGPLLHQGLLSTSNVYGSNNGKNMVQSSTPMQQYQVSSLLPDSSMMVLPKIQPPQYEVKIEETPMPSSSVEDEIDIDIGSFDTLIDFTIPEETVVLPDQDAEIKINDDFDNTEMSILYDFLLDSKNQRQETIQPQLEGNEALTVNLMDENPFDDLLMNFQDDDFEQSVKQKNFQSFDSKTEELLSLIPEVNVLKPPEGLKKKTRRLCRVDGCSKRSRSHGLCIAHGGGRRCSVDGCTKSSQGGSLCIRHGGGKRCTFETCRKAAQSNNLCKAHGGGPRCNYPNCTKSSQGGGFCRTHGGGKRCLMEGCTKGTQRGDFCALHGGSRLCSFQGCLRNDRGGGYCATHGGGKRCTTEGCNKPCRRKGLCSSHLKA